MNLKIKDKIKSYDYIEDAREEIETLWMDLVQKQLPNENNIIMFQEDPDELSFDFHSESELSNNAHSVIAALLKATNKNTISEQILAAIDVEIV